jgi:hypothetical protein
MKPRPQAKPDDYAVISRYARRVHLAIAAMLGGALVMLLHHIPEPIAAPVDDAPMVAACRLPSQDGEMTVFVVEHGKMKCWRWK